MFEEQQIDEFAKELSEHFGPLLTHPQLATLLDRSLGGLRYSLCRAQKPDMVALKACGRKIGRRVYYPTCVVARIVMEQGGQ
jgi:hypothetical protein